MNLTTQQLELIQKYLGDKLSASDEVAFKQFLSLPEFRKELAFQANHIDALEEVDNLLAKESLSSLAKGRQSLSGSKKSKLPFLLLLIPLLLAIYYIYSLSSEVSGEQSTNYSQMAEANAVVYPPREVIRGAEIETGSEKWEEAMDFYSRRDYLSALNSFLLVKPMDELTGLYIANCNIQLKNYEAAIKGLEPLSRSADNEIRQNSEYYLLISQIGKGNSESALSSCDRILERTDHIFYDRVLRLREALLAK